MIARNTAMTYKSKAVDLREIGKELGVRYVLEGQCSKLQIAYGLMRNLSTPRTDRIFGPRG